MHKTNSSTSTHTTEGESPYNAHITHYKWQQKKVFLSFALRNTFRVLKYHRATSEIFVPLDIRQSTHWRVLKRCSFFRNPSELGIKNKFYFTRGGNSYFGACAPVKRHTAYICYRSPIATNNHSSIQLIFIFDAYYM